MKKKVTLLHGSIAKEKTLIAILFLGGILRVVNLNQSLWLDEAAQALESAGSFRGLFEIYADFMPPLFHLLLYGWMRISDSEWWMRLISVVCGVGTIYYLYKLAALKIHKHVAYYAAFLLALSPFHIYYSQELRPYALATLLATASTYYFVQKKWWPYALSSLLMIYSLYTTPFLLLSHGIYTSVFDRKKIKQWFFSMVFIAAGFLPWLPAFLKQLSGGSQLADVWTGWSSAVSVEPFKSLPLTLAKFTLGRVTIDNKIFYAAVVGFIILLIAILLWSAFKKWKKETVELFFYSTLPVCAIFVLSFVLPVIAPQRVLFILPLFLLLIAMGIRALPRTTQTIALLVFMLPSIYGLSQYYINPRFQRENWRDATTYVEKKATDKTQVLFGFPEPFAPYIWYRKNPSLGIGVAKNFVVREDDLKKVDQIIQTNTQLHFFQYLTDLSDPEKKIPAYLESKGYKNTETKDFSGVGLVYTYTK